MKTLFLLLISILMVLPSASWAGGWVLLKASIDERLELQKQVDLLKKADATFPKGWSQAESFDTARECENGKTYVTRDRLSSNEIRQEEASIIVGHFGLRCVPFDYLLKLRENTKAQADFRYDPDTGKLIPLK